MKSLRPILISACFFVSVLNLSAQEIYSRVKIFAPNDNVKKAELIGLLEIDHFNFTSEGALLTEISASELTKLKTTPYKYQILVPDVKKELEELNANYFKAVREGNRVALEQPGSTISNMIPTSPALHEKDTSLRLGAAESIEWNKTASTNADVMRIRINVLELSVSVVTTAGHNN